MNKFVSLLIVLLAIAVATPVLAEERLSLSGYMRVRGWHLDQDQTDTQNTWSDSRLRIIGKVSIAEGVSVGFRSSQAYGGNQGVGTGPFALERAHLDIEKGMFHLRAGKQPVYLGTTFAFDSSRDGFLVNMKGAVPVTAFVLFGDDNKSEDVYEYGLNVGHKTDAYSANVFFAGTNNSAVATSNVRGGEEVYLFGVNFGTSFDAIKLMTEINYFTGDATATTDAYGLQGYVGASVAVAENVTVGGQFFYAQGDKDDVQYAYIGSFDSGHDPLFDIGTGLQNEQLKLSNSPYTLLGNNAGLYAGRVYASMKATDDLRLGASAFYAVADEKDIANYKEGLGVAVGASYALMPKTTLGAQVQYSDLTMENAAADREEFGVGMLLQVSF